MNVLGKLGTVRDTNPLEVLSSMKFSGPSLTFNCFFLFFGWFLPENACVFACLVWW